MPDKIGLLFIGDVIGRPGREALQEYLPRVREKYKPDVIIANGENAAGGIGITDAVSREMFAHADVLTSGNHIWDKKVAVSLLERNPKLLRPANYPPRNPGQGVYIHEAWNGQKVGVVNLQGRVFMEPVDCPFRAADDLLVKLRVETPVILVDFHAEATSEKQALGWYLDGRVSAVIGTHTHVPTADERILPGGTALLTDVGMVGGYDSVIGIKREQAVERFLTSRSQRFEPSKSGLVFSAVYISVDTASGRALSIRREYLTQAEQDGAV
jgi:2',3'-cyclic-nucleotide 2'-phosphodiesterase